MKREEIRVEVFRLKPDFGSVTKTWGDKTLLAYYQQNFVGLKTPSSDVLRVVESETNKILGGDVGKKAKQSLEIHKWVNTADHHGLLCHPYFYTTTLARSHADVRRNTDATVTLPFGGISLGNDSFPRGFFFHSIGGHVERIFFKSLKERRLPVYALSPMTIAEFRHERERALSLRLTPRTHERLELLLNAFVSDTRVWEQKTYSAQLTILNTILWRMLFGDSRGEHVYLEIESVVRTMLLEKHLVAHTNIFNLLFNPLWRDAFIELFAGVPGSHTNTSGTHLFWYIDYKRDTRRRLVIRGDVLTTPEKDIVIPLTPIHIIEGLIKRTLMPSSALSLLVVHGEEHLACGGGSSQLTYLPLMMKKWSVLLSRFGCTTDVPLSEIWAGDNTLYQIENTESAAPQLATLIDCFLYEENFKEKVDETLVTTSISDMVDGVLPSLYHLYTKKEIHNEFLFLIPKICIH